jgi:hypothetical protein
MVFNAWPASCRTDHMACVGLTAIGSFDCLAVSGIASSHASRPFAFLAIRFIHVTLASWRCVYDD